MTRSAALRSASDGTRFVGTIGEDAVTSGTTWAIGAPGGSLRIDVADVDAEVCARIYDVEEAASWLAAVYGDEIAAAVERGAEGEFPLERTPFADRVKRLLVGEWLLRWWPIDAATAVVQEWLLDVEVGALRWRLTGLASDDDVAAAVKPLLVPHLDRIASAVAGGETGFQPDDDLITDLVDAVGDLLGPADARAAAFLRSVEQGGSNPVADAPAPPVAAIPADARPVHLDVRALGARTLELGSPGNWSLVTADAVQVHLAGPERPTVPPLFARVASRWTDWIGVPLARASGGYQGSVPLPPGADVRASRVEIYDARVMTPSRALQDLDAADARLDAIRAVIQHRIDAAGDATAQESAASLLAEIDAAVRWQVDFGWELIGTWTLGRDAVHMLAGDEEAEFSRAGDKSDDHSPPTEPRDIRIADRTVLAAILGRPLRDRTPGRGDHDRPVILRLTPAAPGRIALDLTHVLDPDPATRLQVTLLPGVTATLELEQQERGDWRFAGSVDVTLTERQFDRLEPVVQVLRRR